jgi:hypothetical protein
MVDHNDFMVILQWLKLWLNHSDSDDKLQLFFKKLLVVFLTLV